MRQLAAVLALLLAGCACRVPVYDTAQRVAERDFSKRADPALLACTTDDYHVRLKLVRPKE